MSFVNTTTKTRVIIGGKDVSSHVIEANISDDSAYSNYIITTSGEITLAAEAGGYDILDIEQTAFPIGSKVNVYVTYDNGTSGLHPRGTLYVLGSTVNLQTQQLKLQVTCSLGFISQNEEAYTDAVEELFDSLIPASFLENFVETEKTLSTLASLLETIGYLIYQDAYGYVQRVNLLGADGFGSTRPGKLTSFDKYTAINIDSISDTAIEPNAIAVRVDYTYDIAVKGENEDDQDENDQDPNDGGNETVQYEPLIRSTTLRTIDKPYILPTVARYGNILAGSTYFGYAHYPQDEQDELIRQPDCGKSSDPKESDSSGVQEEKSNIKAYGSVIVANEDYKETVVSGSGSLFDATGKQVSVEEDWEYVSFYTYANSFWGSVLNAFVDAIQTNIQDANTLLSKANQLIDKRNTYDTGNSSRRSNQWTYYNCQADYYLRAAGYRVEAADSIFQSSKQFFWSRKLPYNLSTYRRTVYTYNDDGSLRSRIEYSYINKFALDRVVASGSSIVPSYVQNKGTEGEESGYRFVGMNYTAVTAALTNQKITVNEGDQTWVFNGGEPTPGIIADGTFWDIFKGIEQPEQPLFNSVDDFGNKLDDKSLASIYNLSLISKTVTSYAYSQAGAGDVETQEFIDLQDPSRSYIRKNFSTNGQTRSELTASMASSSTIADPGDPTDLAGNEYCNIETESIESLAKVMITRTDLYDTSGWFGTAQGYEKSVGMPIQFASLVPRKEVDEQAVQSIQDQITEINELIAQAPNQTTIDQLEIQLEQKQAELAQAQAASCELLPDYTARIRKYQEIATRYATLIAKKISGDRRGFRVTEKMRPEIAQYYPFFPVSLSLESITRGFTARTAQATWAFNSDNAVCVFDCFLTGTGSVTEFPDPSKNTIQDAANADRLLTKAFLNISPVTAYIIIRSLPTEGYLRVDGVDLEVGDVIAVSVIEQERLYYIPPAVGIYSIDFSYTQVDVNGGDLSSIVNIYPIHTTTLPDQDEIISDGGDFTLNIATGPLSADAGDFTTAITLGGVSLDGGDFTTGGEIPFPEISFGSTAPSGNGQIDPEADYSTDVVNGNGDIIPVDTLPNVDGANTSIVPVDILMRVVPRIRLRVRMAIREFDGWDYGFIQNPYGYSISGGTIATPSTLSLDFGSLVTPNEPLPTSSVS